MSVHHRTISTGKTEQYINHFYSALLFVGYSSKWVYKCTLVQSKLPGYSECTMTKIH